MNTPATPRVGRGQWDRPAAQVRRMLLDVQTQAMIAARTCDDPGKQAQWQETLDRLRAAQQAAQEL